MPKIAGSELEPQIASSDLCSECPAVIMVPLGSRLRVWLVLLVIGLASLPAVVSGCC